MGIAEELLKGVTKRDTPSAGVIGGTSDRYDNLASSCEAGDEGACKKLKELFPNGRPENKPNTSPAHNELKRK